MSEAAKLSLEDLPTECLEEITRRLPGDQARSALACASKLWLKLVSNIRRSDMDFAKTNEGRPRAALGDDVFITRYLDGWRVTDITLAAISVGTSSRGGYRKLQISSTNRVTDAGLKLVAYGCPSLQALSLRHIPTVGDEGLSEIAKGCRRLKKLELCFCTSVTDKALIEVAKRASYLTSLSIELCPGIGNEGLQEIGFRCQRLSSVTVIGCNLVGDSGVASLVASRSSVLSKLELKSLRIGDETLAAIGRYGTSLVTLVLVGLPDATVNGFSLMGKLKGLTKLASLTVMSCPGMKDEVLHALGDACCSLKQVHFGSCSLSDIGITIFVEFASSLISLHLENCNGVTLFGVLGALAGCGSKLETLALVKRYGMEDIILETPIIVFSESLNSRFGNRSLPMVGVPCAHLQDIDLSGLTSLTDSVLLLLVKHFCWSGLIKVRLSGCLNLTDEVVFEIAKGHGRTLKVLELDGCVQITDASLVAVVEYCSVLKDLNMSKSSITDFGIATLSSGGLPKLEVLYISGCSEVSDKSMDSLLKLGEKLSILSISGCKSISDSTVGMLETRLARMRDGVFMGRLL